MHAQARECVSTRIWWVVGGLNSGLNFSIIVSEPHPLGKIYNPAVVHVRTAWLTVPYRVPRTVYRDPYYDYSIPNRNLHSAEDPSTFLVVLSYRWSTRRCRGLRPAGIVESAPGVPAHPEGPLSRLLLSSRRLEVEVKVWRATAKGASFG